MPISLRIISMSDIKKWALYDKTSPPSAWVAAMSDMQKNIQKQINLETHSQKAILLLNTSAFSLIKDP